MTQGQEINSLGACSSLPWLPLFLNLLYFRDFFFFPKKEGKKTWILQETLKEIKNENRWRDWISRTKLSKNENKELNCHSDQAWNLINLLFCWFVLLSIFTPTLKNILYEYLNFWFIFKNQFYLPRLICVDFPILR